MSNKLANERLRNAKSVDELVSTWRELEKEEKLDYGMSRFQKFVLILLVGILFALIF